LSLPSLALITSNFSCLTCSPHSLEMPHSTLGAFGLALLSALPAAQAGLYLKSSPVLQVTAKNYDQLVAQSNHTTVRSAEGPRRPATHG